MHIIIRDESWIYVMRDMILSNKETIILIKKRNKISYISTRQNKKSSISRNRFHRYKQPIGTRT